jgi:hypothetical protein
VLVRLDRIARFIINAARRIGSRNRERVSQPVDFAAATAEGVDDGTNN